MANRFRHFIPRIAAAIFLLVSVLAGFLILKDFFDVSILRDILSKNKLLALSTYFLLQVFQSISIILPLTPLTIAGGLAFGAKMGFLFSWVGVLAGQLLAFTLSKYLGASFVQKRIGNLRISPLEKIVAADRPSVKGAVLLLIAYFSFIVSFDVIAYSLGLTHLKYRWMLIISSIGVIPKLFILSVLGGTVVLEVDKFWFLAGMIMFFALIGFSTYGLLRRRK